MRWVCSVLILAGAAAAREVSLGHHQLRHHELVHPLVLHPDTAQPQPYKEHHTRVRYCSALQECACHSERALSNLAGGPWGFGLSHGLEIVRRLFVS